MASWPRGRDTKSKRGDGVTDENSYSITGNKLYRLVKKWIADKKWRHVPFKHPPPPPQPPIPLLLTHAVDLGKVLEIQVFDLETGHTTANHIRVIVEFLKKQPWNHYYR